MKTKTTSFDPTLPRLLLPLHFSPLYSKIIPRGCLSSLPWISLFSFSLETFQTGFRLHHSTGIALVKVTHDLHVANSKDQIPILVLLDLWAALDTAWPNSLLVLLWIHWPIVLSPLLCKVLCLLELLMLECPRTLIPFQSLLIVVVISFNLMAGHVIYVLMTSGFIFPMCVFPLKPRHITPLPA